MNVRNGEGGWSGIIPPLVTPLADCDTLDGQALERVIEHVLAAGVSGIFILGSTGEGPGLSYRLRRQMISESCRLVNGRVPVLVCITDTAYSESVALANDAERHGAAATVAAAPYYFWHSQADLARYVDRLTADTGLPLFLYNMPKLTKVSYSVATVARAADNPKVAGMKDSGGDMQYLANAIQAVAHRPDFAVFIGPEEMLVEGMRLGVHGGVTGGANLNPRLFVDMYRAARAGNWEEADKLQQVSRAMSDALYTVGEPESSYLRGLKCAMAAVGLCSDVLALPYAPLAGEERRLIQERMLKLGGTPSAA